MGARQRFDRGASAVEYAILVAATAAILIVGMVVFRDVLSAAFQAQCGGTRVVGHEPDGTPIYNGNVIGTNPDGSKVYDQRCD